VYKAVQEEAQRARVAAQFLPLFGPVDPSTVGVPRLALDDEPAPQGSPSLRRLRVNSEPDLLLTTISVLVSLHARELADPELLAALTMFRRAANCIARIEDALILLGQSQNLPLQARLPAIGRIPQIYSLSGATYSEGLLPDPNQPGNPPPPRLIVQIPQPQQNLSPGDALVDAIIQATVDLESAGQLGPYACVLGNQLFTRLVAPATNQLVIPRDRVLPFLDGPLVRSSVLPPLQGVVVALAGNPVELVVASDLAVNYLQTTLEPRAVFRVSERLALRIKDFSAIAVLS
jgi:uncharacterized linocin/CFP29 family protein